MFQLSLELTAPSFYLWEPPRRFLKEPYISAHNSAQVKFLQVFLKSDFLGGKYFFENKFLIILSFLGLLYVLGYFKQKKIFFQIFFSPNHVVYLQFRLVSSILELQSKSWILELKLELSALWELSQSCSSDSAFRKGLVMKEGESQKGSSHFYEKLSIW